MWLPLENSICHSVVLSGKTLGHDHWKLLGGASRMVSSTIIPSPVQPDSFLGPHSSLDHGEEEGTEQTGVGFEAFSLGSFHRSTH